MDQIAEILSNLGVTWPKFIAQIIIFLLVYSILKKYAFGPVTAILEERRKRIEEAEADRSAIKKQLADSESLAAAKVAEANNTATRLITEARESANALAEKERQRATQEAQEILAKAREASKREREQQLASLKKDFGKLVIEATGKVTGKVLTSEDQEKINKETAAQLAS